MTWVDTIVLLVLAVSALLAFLRGFVREALGLCAWGGAIWIAVVLFPRMQPVMRRHVANPEIADPAAFGATFLLALIALSVVAGLLGRVVRLSALGGLDRTIGLVFGLLRGALVVSAVYLLAGLVIAVPQWPDAVLAARTLPYAYEGARWIAAELPPAYAPKVSPPPAATGAQPSPPGPAPGRREEHGG